MSLFICALDCSDLWPILNRGRDDIDREIAEGCMYWLTESDKNNQYPQDTTISFDRFCLLHTISRFHSMYTRTWTNFKVAYICVFFCISHQIGGVYFTRLCSSYKVTVRKNVYVSFSLSTSSLVGMSLFPELFRACFSFTFTSFINKRHKWWMPF